jgi:GTP-binding protein
VHVLSGIDATKLTSYEDLAIKQNVTCIIFNFPHVGGKMKINENRKLLKDFFTSANNLLLAKRNQKIQVGII